mmetsp:Transcript_101722/g.291857  ORF Transcript_101722/g.291857 Transcript_101722/m.291857 type:complete len:81 (+) Transcript_101722:363-605(+)
MAICRRASMRLDFLRDGSMSEIVDMRDAAWYQEDWFGLKTLDEAKKVDQYSTPGNHLLFTLEFLSQMVQKYFTASPTMQI